MYANSMLIVLPNDMSCCWQERAEGNEGTEEMEVQNRLKIPVLSHVESILVFRHKNCNLFYYFFFFFFGSSRFERCVWLTTRAVSLAH